MKFLTKGDFNNSRLLQIILVFTLVYVLLLWVTNLLLYSERIGFTYDGIVNYYLGSEEEFKNPVSYIGLLEATHWHLFVFAMALLLVNHLTVFSNIHQFLKLFLIIVSFLSGLGDMSAGWLIRFVSPSFAYLKLWSFIAFQTSFLILLVFSFTVLRIYNGPEKREPTEKG
ncbi:MAG: hypothetical protein Q8P28_10265 [Deltaproteobacteria bacterium]|nr:hypothetical protein [Deltaproteobacteria bacterium]